MKRVPLFISLVLFLSFIFFILYQVLSRNSISLNFSDAAKYALIAKNIFLKGIFSSDFSFWGKNLFSVSGIPRLIPYSIVPFFKIFGINDLSVILSSLFYFLCLLIAVYLLGSKLFGKFSGFLSVLAVASNFNFLDYATSGASEPLFAFETVFSFYLVTLRKKWATLLCLIFLIAMYFTRPQAFIFVAGVILYFLLSRLDVRKAFKLFFVLALSGIIVDRFLIYPLSFKFPLTSVIYRGLQSVLTYSSLNAVSDSLRGGISSVLTISDIGKKVFYNLYNFYKALPVIANPYLWTMFFLGIFSWESNKFKNSYKISIIFTTTVVFLVTALSIPFYRYIHPVIPLVYILSSATTIEIVKCLTKERNVKVISLALLTLFSIVSTLGKYLLDTRFKAKLINKNKPPVYAVMSYKLKENTSTEDIIVTNLDTWGSWYGERKTVWFPLNPKMLTPSEGQKNPFDAIYLTNYLMDDENYYMGEEWRKIFDNPEKIEDKYISENYILKGIYKVSSEDNYERQEGRAVLLVRK